MNNLLIRVFSRFPVNEKIEKSHKNKSYDQIIEKEFNLKYSQIYLGSSFISGFLILLLSLIFFGKSPIVQLIFLLFGLVLRFYLLNYFRLCLKKKTDLIDSFIILIKNNFELFSSLAPKDYDKCHFFINLMSELESPIQNDFITIAKYVQMGYSPEILLNEYKCLSTTFKGFINQLLITKFDIKNTNFSYFEKLESNFTEFNQSLETRLSLFFFIGIFFPLGLCFAAILNKINGMTSLIILPGYLLLLRYLMNHYVKKNSDLIGVLIYENQEIRKEYLEYLNLFLSITSNLIYYNPEEAFFRSYDEIPKNLKKTIGFSIKKLQFYGLTLEDFLDEVCNSIKGKKTKILFRCLRNMLLKDSYNTSFQIKNILSVLKKHQEIERERESIIKGQYFKAKLFLILLPIIIGMISGILPIMFNLFEEYNNAFYDLMPFSINQMKKIDLVLLIFSQYILVVISGYFFSKMIEIKVSFGLILFISLIYVISLLFSYTYIQNMVLILI